MNTRNREPKNDRTAHFALAQAVECKVMHVGVNFAKPGRRQIKVEKQSLFARIRAMI